MSGRAEVAFEAINTMEQGIIVWSPDGTCELFNSQFVKVNNLRRDDIFVGCKRSDFFKISAARRKMDDAAVAQMESNYANGKLFKLDLHTGTGQVIRIAGHPRNTGGYVVTYWDVTESRRGQAELDLAREAAEKAEAIAQDALSVERRRKREARLSGELGEWLQSCKSLDELYTVVSKFMSKLFPTTSGELYVFSNSRDALEGACCWNNAKLHQHIHADDCWALRRGRMFKYGSGLVDFHCNHVDEAVAEAGGRYMCMPIVAHGDTVGLLHIGFGANAETNVEVSDEMYLFALQCSEQISLAIANVKLRDELRHQSTKDSLTGLYNRRYFLETCRREFSIAERKQLPVGVIFFDVDNFKTFNDNHGHDAGDMVLRGVSEIMHKACAKRETPCRYGGEEFAVLLPGSDLAQSSAFAEQLRAQIELLSVRYGGKDLPKISISAGVSGFPDFGHLPQDVINAADLAVYEAKAAGKNRVCAAKAENQAA